MFDAVKVGDEDETIPSPSSSQAHSADGENVMAQMKPTSSSAAAADTSSSSAAASEAKGAKSGKKEVKDEDMEEYYEFEEDDANLLDLISSYGQAPSAGSKVPVAKKGKK